MITKEEGEYMKKAMLIASLIIIAIPTSTLAKERLSIGYIYNSSITHSQIVENTKESVNVVSPTSFDLDSNGRLVVNSLMNKEFIAEMHEKNIKVTPFLSNHWERKKAKKALDKPEKLVEDIVNAVNEYDLDGINIDLENLTSGYRNKLTTFMELLREALPSDKTLSIAVAANPEKLETTWVAAYDYEKLAQCTDYLILMAYDEHCQGGSPGPVASIDFVEKSIKVVLENVSKDKLVLGIPLYGRFWKDGEEYGGEAIVIGCVENIIKKYRNVPEFDTQTMTPKLKVEIDEIRTNAFVNGRYLEAGVYDIWYENENSIKAKLKLINKYNLLGAGLWALDNESKAFWEYYKDALNETEYESEDEIRIRKRADAYAKIIKVKPIEIKINIPWKRTKLEVISTRDISNFKELAEKKYKIIEAIEINESLKLVKDKKICDVIKESNKTITFAEYIKKPLSLY